MEENRSTVILFGDVIRKHRTKLKITQNELAEMMNISRNTVINWETDKRKPDYSLIPAICEILGIKTYELFGVPPENNLSALEDRVVNNLRMLSPASRKAIDKMIYTMLNEELYAKDTALKNTYGLFLVRPGMAAAGVGDYVPDSAPIYTFLRKNTVNERADGIVMVDGDSMEPVYHSGDYVYYENAVSAAPGEDVIVDTDDGAVIKRVSADNTLYSVNPDIPYPKKSEQNTLVIRGRVLGVVYSSDRPAEDEEESLELLFGDEIREFNIKHGVTE
jgi:repressor LexA